MVNNMYEILINLFSTFSLASINSLASTIAYVVAAYVGIKGLNTWKSQLKGNQDYHLAKALMFNIYKYQEAMNNLRSPPIWAAEYPDFSDELKTTIEEKRFKELTYAYQ